MHRIRQLPGRTKPSPYEACPDGDMIRPRACPHALTIATTSNKTQSVSGVPWWGCDQAKSMSPCLDDCHNQQQNPVRMRRALIRTWSGQEHVPMPRRLPQPATFNCLRTGDGKLWQGHAHFPEFCDLFQHLSKYGEIKDLTPNLYCNVEK